MDSVIQFLFLEDNKVFLISLITMSVILGLEILSMLVGMSLSGLMNHCVDMNHCHIDHPHVHVDGDHSMDVEKPNFALGFLSWVNAGQVPLLILIVCFMGTFAGVGFSIQWVAHSFLPKLLPTLMAVPIAVMLTIPVVRETSKIVGKILPQDNTNAVSVDSLVGMYGTCTLGPATKACPGEVRVRDDYGTYHYMRIVPEGDGAIEQGAIVVLLERQTSDGDIFVAR